MELELCELELALLSLLVELELVELELALLTELLLLRELLLLPELLLLVELELMELELLELVELAELLLLEELPLLPELLLLLLEELIGENKLPSRNPCKPTWPAIKRKFPAGLLFVLSLLFSSSVSLADIFFRIIAPEAADINVPLLP